MKKKYNADLICPFCKNTYSYTISSNTKTVTCQECRIVFEIYSLEGVLLKG